MKLTQPQKRVLKVLQRCDGPGDLAWTRLASAGDTRAAYGLETKGLAESGRSLTGRVEFRLTELGRRTKW